ncbi:hypothetical protein NEIRO03_2528 [Nematocida sp. AWRm78]|nr:hypothetical protein NEIRO02_2561 [Nematocida sp. AWRm79]KAI5187404.1 hypothetical protein NEIRO03_2528 [Nematocida sp. AWRm78]
MINTTGEKINSIRKSIPKISLKNINDIIFASTKEQVYLRNKCIIIGITVIILLVIIIWGVSRIIKKTRKLYIKKENLKNQQWIQLENRIKRLVQEQEKRENGLDKLLQEIERLKHEKELERQKRELEREEMNQKIKWLIHQFKQKQKMDHKQQMEHKQKIDQELIQLKQQINQELERQKMDKL